MKKAMTCLAGAAALALATAGTAAAQPLAPVFQAPAGAFGCPPTGTGYAPPGGGWGPVSQSDCGVAGAPGVKLGYSYTSRSDASPIHASAYHFTNLDGQNPGPAVWTEFGAGPSGQSGLLVWGNSLATPQIKFQSVNVLGAIVDWQA